MLFLTIQFRLRGAARASALVSNNIGVRPSTRKANQFRSVSDVRVRPGFTTGGASTKWSVRCQKGELRVSSRMHDEGILTEAEMTVPDDKGSPSARIPGYGQVHEHSPLGLSCNEATSWAKIVTDNKARGLFKILTNMTYEGTARPVVTPIHSHT